MGRFFEGVVRLVEQQEGDHEHDWDDVSPILRVQHRFLHLAIFQHQLLPYTKHIARLPRPSKTNLELPSNAAWES
jgi:hypothetical protein